MGPVKSYSKMKLFTFLLPFAFSFPDKLGTDIKLGLSSQEYGTSDCKKISVTTTINAQNCQKTCEFSSKCYYWTWDKSKNNCHLKDEHGLFLYFLKCELNYLKRLGQERGNLRYMWK